jgi:exopolysaccharide production protein ExoQ
VNISSQTRYSGTFLCDIGGFILAFRSCLTYLFFQSSPQVGTAVRLAGSIAWLLAVVAYTILQPPTSASLPKRSSALRWIALYVALAGVSLFWTTTASLTVEVGYWAGLLADVAAVYLLLRFEAVEENTRRTMRGYIFGVSLVAILAWTAPAMEDMRLGNEDFLHPNFIGFQFAIGALAAAWLAQRKKAWAWMAAALGVTTIRTLSKATIVALLFAGLYYLLRGLKVGRKVKVWVAIGSSMVLLSFWGLLEEYLDVYSQGSNVETLTGRTYIWQQSLNFVLEKPWLGHGFDSFRWIFPSFNQFLPNHAHNELLQQLFAYGVVGLLVVVGVYWSFYRQVRSSRQSALRSFAMAVLILVLVRGLVDTDQFDLGFPLWLMTLLSIALAQLSFGPETTAV